MSGIKERIFNNSPLWIKGGLLGVYSWLHSGSKYGPIYQAELAALRSRAVMGASDLKKAQADLLAQFLNSVRSTNYYYKSMMDRKGVDLYQIEKDPVAALLSLDLMEKDFLKSNIDLLTDSPIDIAGVSHTSGTSGSPMKVPYEVSGYQKAFAYWRRFYDDMGLPDSFRNARFSGRVLLGNARNPDIFWVNDWFERRLFFSTYHMTDDNLSLYVARLNKYRPHLIDGYPSALAILARYIESSGERLTFTPLAAAATAETLFDEDRVVIERVFGCRLYNQYASSEGAPFITECRSGRMHLNTDTGYFEFLDLESGSNVKELVVTSFRNLKLPLIRYRIGDSVRLDSEGADRCTCGSRFPTIANVEGRVDDLLYSTERGAIGRLDPVYKGVVGIKRSQIIQEDADVFTIIIVPDFEFNQSTLEKLEENFRARVGSSVSLRIDVVDDIPLSSNGKFRSVVNRSSRHPK
ncbi:hypothetical protein [Ottowia caeni]|uniref:hypothetical protein n=1 Tax=Ottowia caeni TaxID=2870339 RepID=UPI001E5FA5A5|nr:hypothetical protein [Ottowia caeni]